MDIIKKKAFIAIIAAILAVTAGVGFAYADAKVPGDFELPFTSNHVDNGTYSVYEPFGLTINSVTGKLYYDGKLVRCFDDKYPGEDFSVKAIGYYEEAGQIDVRAVRDSNNSIVGLEALSETEFKNRVISDESKPYITKKQYIFRI